MKRGRELKRSCNNEPLQMINHQPDKIRALISHTYQRYFLLYKNTNEKENIWKISGPVGIFTIAYQLDCLSIGRQTHTRGAFSVAQIINMLGFMFKQDFFFRIEVDLKVSPDSLKMSPIYLKLSLGRQRNFLVSYTTFEDGVKL